MTPEEKKAYDEAVERSKKQLAEVRAEARKDAEKKNK